MLAQPTPVLAGSTARVARSGARARAAALLAGLSLLAATATAFDLQGHRGARGLTPENTLASFERALAEGVTTLELDIAITRDRVLVIHHDLAFNPDITRDASGRWLTTPSAPIHTLSWAELQTVDVGRINPASKYASNHPQQMPIDGTRIPRLADLFDFVKRGGHDRVRFAIETKLNPLRPDATLPAEEFARLVLDEIRRAAGGRIWSADFGDLDAAQVREAKSLGLSVLAWTVNDAPTMGRMIDLGVEGLITDRPDLARRVLAERGIVPK